MQNKFSSPEYPHSYPEGFTCQWNITAPPGYFVKVYFEMFKLQYNNRNLYCTNGDYVELRDGSSSQDDLIKRFCYSGETSTLPPIVTGVYSTGRHMYMKFRSDPRGPNRQGFSVTYTAVKQGGFWIIHKLLLLLRRGFRGGAGRAAVPPFGGILVRDL